MRRPALAALALLGVGWAAILLLHPWSADNVSDLYLYRQYAHLFLHGDMPYRDVGFEYPPLAALVVAAPGVLGTGPGYDLAFAGLALGLAVAVVLLCGRLAAATGGDPRRALLAAGAAPLLAGAMIRTHFDLAPVALLLGALLLLVRDRPRAGMAVLGLGAMTKGFPLLAAPVALAWLWGRGRRREALAGLAAMLAVIAGVAAVAVALSPSGALDALRYHVDRPVQIESVPALVLRALDAVGAGHARTVNSFRSQGFEHPAAGVVTVWFLLVMLAVLVWLAAAAARDREPRAVVLGSLAAAAAFATFGKVLSPQFLIWTIPLGALALAWGMDALAAVVALATVLTLVEFPTRYFDLVHRDAFPVAVVVLRDLLLVAAVGLAVRALSLARAPAAARSPWLAPARRPRPARR